MIDWQPLIDKALVLIQKLKQNAMKVFLFSLAFMGLVYLYFSYSLPRIYSIEDYRPLGVTQVIMMDGEKEKVIAEFFKERRYLVPMDQIPKVVVNAFISAEDDSFFEHQGISFSSIIRAAIANFRAGHVVQGGSTITQQVAKSLFLTPDRNIIRKIKEVILAGRLEKHLNKDEILFLYLNQIYLGNGAYGIQAASEGYFGKNVEEISLPEAALLAGMPRAPSKYNPFSNPKKAKERQLYVLRRMYENNYITEEQMVEASVAPLKIHRHNGVDFKYGKYYVEHIRRYLLENYGEKAVYEDALKVYLPTTVDAMRASKEAMTVGLRSVDKQRGYRGPLKKLLTQEEIHEFLKTQREEMIKDAVVHEVFLPDGRTDIFEGMQDAGIVSDEDMIEVGGFYEGVVTDVNDREGKVTVMIGSIECSLPMSEMKWARRILEDGDLGPAPNLPSQVVEKGDVIYTKIQEKKKNGFLLALDQQPEVQGALYSIDVATGYLLALEGGYDFDMSEFNRAVQAERQPGSAFKLIIYSAGLEMGYTPATIIVDSPIVFKDDEIGKWKPTNFEEKFYGDTTFRLAFIKSRNIPTIKLAQRIGVKAIIDYARKLGMEGKFNEDLSISLGSATTTLKELTTVYSLYARLGRRVNPIFVTKVIDRNGRILEENLPQVLPREFPLLPLQNTLIDEQTGAKKEENEAQKEESDPMLDSTFPMGGDPDQVIDPRISYLMTHLMKGVVDYGTGRKAKVLGRPTAGKTGTTSEFKDAWFVGFTPEVVTGVWVGYDDLKSLGSGATGSGAALPIWVDFMEDALKNYTKKEFTVPPGIAFHSIDLDTGKIVPPQSPGSVSEAFIEGTEPKEQQAGTEDAVDTQGEFFKEDFE